MTLKTSTIIISILLYGHCQLPATLDVKEPDNDNRFYFPKVSLNVILISEYLKRRPDHNSWDLLKEAQCYSICSISFILVI